MSALDPVLLAVIANRLDTIVREMENTLLRSGRSAVLNQARDFSCALVTGDANGVQVEVKKERIPATGSWLSIRWCSTRLRTTRSL